MSNHPEILRAVPGSPIRTKKLRTTNFSPLQHCYEIDDVLRSSRDSILDVCSLLEFSFESVDENTIDNGQIAVVGFPHKPFTVSRLLIGTWVVAKATNHKCDFLYKLNSGSVGVCFTDGTQIIASIDYSFFQYHENHAVHQAYYMKNHPSFLLPKVDVLLQAISCFNSAVSPNGRSQLFLPGYSAIETIPTLNPNIGCCESEEIVLPSEPLLTYVVCSASRSKAVLYRLSNRTVQAVFCDNRYVTYVTSNSRTEHTIDEIKELGLDNILAMLKYIKPLVMKVLHSGKR